jgi:iron(III) transport system permease protein
MRGGRDRTAGLLAAVVIVYLAATLALPLAAIVLKSFETYAFNLEAVEIEFFADGEGWKNRKTAAQWALEIDEPINGGARPGERTRLALSELLPKSARRGVEKFRVRDLSAKGGLILYEGALSASRRWIEFDRRELRAVLLRPQGGMSAANYAEYLRSPALRHSAANSIFVSLATTLIVIPLAFFFALAIARSRAPFKPFFRFVALAPILVPSLLPGLGLVYLFGKQGALKALLLGHSIYGPIGIIAASVFYTFPHAFIILLTALSVADRRLYEAATVLRAPPAKIFFTVTLPGARYGLISAAFVVFTLVITDFGVPKVIGGGYNVLALDIYKNVVGQQNFQLGAVVSMLLLLPAAIAFAAERAAAKRQAALLTPGAVPASDAPPGRARTACLFFVCAAVAVFIIGILLMCQLAALFKFWPYDLTPGLRHYDFSRTDGGGWDAYANSMQMALGAAFFGTALIFLGAYVTEKVRGLRLARAVAHFLAMMPMAVPGMVLGLSFIFFYNAPSNPLNFLYGTMAILIISTITHFYTVAHLTATTALKQLDREYESVSLSLRQPLHRMLRRVTIPVCMPAILDISVYLFINAMTTVSAVVFLYSPDTTLASVAVLNMDDAGDAAPAAAMGMMIFYTNVGMRAVHHFATRRLRERAQAWRTAD